MDDEANAGRMGAVPMAIVAEGKRGRIYLSIDEAEGVLLQHEIENYYAANEIEKKVSHAQCRGTFASNAQGRYYGFHEFKDYFTHRQITALTTFSALEAEAQQKAEADAVAVGMVDDHLSLHNGGQNAKAYGEAVGVYLAIAVDRLADRSSSICSWDNGYVKIRNTFSIQGIPMAWNYAEGNPFSHSTGSFQGMVEWVTKCLLEFPASTLSTAEQCDAQSDCGLRSVMLSTDPPYYDNVGYADLSDFFYVWLRQSLKDTYPELFPTMLVPKEEELVAIPYRHENNKEKAKSFFENGMLSACKQMYLYAREDIPVTIYYAYKQSDSDADGNASSGWETMLNAVVNAGFTITGTWPMRTELTNRAGALTANSLASWLVRVWR